ncbi:MAG: heavy metal translocating P-type ATPase [Chloroflexi bacterium]|nr:heavy metal translocating P-type ATPase [Chloroflexota bacterium]
MNTGTSSGNLKKLQVKIGGMQCSFCVETLRRAFLRLEGVQEASISLAHEEALVMYDPARVTPQQFKNVLADMGYTWRDPEKVMSFEEEEAELGVARKKFLFGAGAAGIVVIFMVLMWLGTMQPWFLWPMLALALATMFGPAWHIKKMAWASLRRGILNQHVLLEFAAFAGLAGGFIGFFQKEFPIPDFFGVATFVTAYHLFSGYISLLARTRSSQAIKRLMALQPETARIIRDGREEEVATSEVRQGDLVRVRPGESIPVDGVIEEGYAGIDQRLVTGEPMPVEKTKGDDVIGGSINQTGALVIRVTRVGAESFLQKVAQSIQEARALKPGILILVDRVLKYFVPGVLIAAGIAFLIWTLGAWAVTGSPDFSRAVFAALAALVMGYPCALGMASPLAMIRGGGIAAEKGILMRSGEAFQVFKDVRRIVLDKTGTITRGEPSVSDIGVADGIDRNKFLRLVSSVESLSEHALARAIVDHITGMDITPGKASDFQTYAGKGVSASVDGTRVVVGTARFLAEQGIDVLALDRDKTRLEEEGKTVVLAAINGKPAGVIAISDTIKEDALEAVESMRKAGLEPVMITGDNWRTARTVAGQVGIEKVLAEVLPGDKAEEVRKLQHQGYRVAMVGDGINDAPALMQADVGIAVGTGTDIAIESADIILIGERLTDVMEAYRIGKNSYTKTVQNVSLAFTFNGIGVPAAVTGLVHPVWAMIAMAASVTTVLLNSFGGRIIRLPHFQRAREERVLTLEVPSIHCEGCGETIEKALKKLTGVQDVKVDIAEKLVDVTLRDGATVEQDIQNAIVRAGHTVAGHGHS